MLINRFKIVMVSPPPFPLLKRPLSIAAACTPPALIPPPPTPAAFGSLWPHRGGHEMWGTGGGLEGGATGVFWGGGGRNPRNFGWEFEAG